MNTFSKINYKIIVHILGLLAIVNGLFMLMAAGTSWFYQDGQLEEFLLSGAVTIGAGTLLMLLTRIHRKEIQKREGYIIVTSGWITMAFIGTIPFIFTAAIPNFTDAFFESMSGYSASGASILPDVEIMPPSILLWRSITHWIGGMGIIVLAIAVLPLLGIGGMQLFAAEVPGPAGDKLHPRITDTAKRLWLIYVGYTLLETILLKMAGMGWFDAVNHSMSTLSTGGFSTKNASIGYWNDNPAIQYIIVIFMFIGSCNLLLSYLAFKGRFRRVLKDEEFRMYIWLTLLFTAIIAAVVYLQTDFVSETATLWGGIEHAVRHALFQVVSVISTTAFLTTDFTLWTPFITTLFFGMFFLGGSGGSTAGGIKLIRHLILIRNGILEFKRTLHPHAILPVRYNDKAVPRPIVFNVLGFFILYMLTFIIGALVFAFLGLDYETAVGGSASILGNVGPALGQLSPSDTYAELPALAKWWSCFLMLLGRLELFTVLILFTPFFWRNR
ncbi:MAG TPA: potassium transporter TrkG [Flavobacteriaceae bacterium]|nr:potassium transporter TrkG [Flavobacteriaceae bacterium]